MNEFRFWVLIGLSITVSVVLVLLWLKQRSRRRAKDYEILLTGLRNQAVAQAELVNSLTAAVEISTKYRNSGRDELTSNFGEAALSELKEESEKLKAQVAFIEQIEKKRDLEFRN